MSASKGQTLPAGQNNTHQPSSSKHAPHSHIIESHGGGHGQMGRREGASNSADRKPDGNGGKKQAKASGKK